MKNIICGHLITDEASPVNIMIVRRAVVTKHHQPHPLFLYVSIVMGCYGYV